VSESSYLPERKIEIDKEGFPVFSGLRADDETLLFEYAKNLKRSVEGENKFPLITKCGGVEVWVESFDCPLVAQSIRAFSETSCEWVFPGGYSAKVSHNQMSVDRWERLHAFIGKDEIPAVFSRKAQAEFLSKINVETFRPQPYWPNVDEVSSASRWDSAYREEKQGWEMGGVNPALSHYGLPSLLQEGSSVLVPGAGRGHDAEWISQRKAKVTALDFSPLAQAEFRMSYPTSSVEYRSDDVFEYLKASSESFDGIFEHTIFCAINPSRRLEYLDGVYNALKADGIYFGLFFQLSWVGGPPFGLTQWELNELIKDRFNIKAWEIAEGSHPRRKGRELWAVLQKKS